MGNRDTIEGKRSETSSRCWNVWTRLRLSLNKIANLEVFEHDEEIHAILAKKGLGAMQRPMVS